MPWHIFKFYIENYGVKGRQNVKYPSQFQFFLDLVCIEFPKIAQ